MDEDLAAIRNIVNAAKLSEELRQTILWCLGQLPRLYHQLCEELRDPA